MEWEFGPAFPLYDDGKNVPRGYPSVADAVSLAPQRHCFIIL